MRTRMWMPATGILLLSLASWYASVKVWSPPLTFLLCALTIIALARRIGSATEKLARRLGSTLGALLSATFGNSVELIISIAALRAGLYRVVQASIVGSVLANLLLTLGVCMMIGGITQKVQVFSRARAGLNSVMLFIAVFGLSMTSLYQYFGTHAGHAKALGVSISIVFLLIYALGFVFSFFTHRSFLMPVEEIGATERQTEPLWPHLLELIVATFLVSLVSEGIVGAIEPLSVRFSIPESFVGMILLPLIGIAPEFFSAILLARRGNLDGSMEIGLGSSLQIALFVAPALVLIDTAMRGSFTLVFTPVEVLVLFLSTLLVSLVSLDGETHWYEGMMVTAAYVMLGLLFFFQ